MSKRTSPTEAGQINRQVSEEEGRARNSGTGAEFEQSRSEYLDQGGEMQNRKSNEELKDKNLGHEQSRRPDSGGEFGSSSGRSGQVDRGNSGVSSDQSTGRRGKSGSMDEIGDVSGSRRDERE